MYAPYMAIYGFSCEFSSEFSSTFSSEFRSEFSPEFSPQHREAIRLRACSHYQSDTSQLTDHQTLIWPSMANICTICRSYICHIWAIHKLYISHAQPTVQYRPQMDHTQHPENEGPRRSRRPIFFIFIVVHLWPVL